MATWKLSPQYKKSAVEKMFFYKDGKCITIEQGFRWATFTVESDTRPLTDEELKNEDGYELGCIDNDECWEMWEMMDGCWLDIEAYRGDISEEEQQAFEEAWEEDSYEGVEALGWSNDDTEYYYNGPLELTNEDTGEVFQGEPDDSDITTSVTPVIHYSNTDNPIDFPEEVKSPYTDWYPVSTDPVRVGSYQVLYDQIESKWPFGSNIQEGVWNGKKWDNKKVVKWRGLTEDPNTSK